MPGLLGFAAAMLVESVTAIYFIFSMEMLYAGGPFTGQFVTVSPATRCRG